MHIGKSYPIIEFLMWTRKNIYKLLIIGIIPPVLYQIVGLKWIAIPWTVVSLLGTATAFLIGFKNTQTYNRTWEARQIWGGILNGSRSWGITCRDYLNQPEKAKEIINLHFAWLTCLRFQMREPKNWENTSKAYNQEYTSFYSIPEWETTLEKELTKYLKTSEIESILKYKNKAAQILSHESLLLKKLVSEGELDSLHFLEMEKIIRDFYDYQGKSERIKNFPYPRQFATVNGLFIKLFCILLPFGMLKEFDKLNEGMTGILHGNMVWLVVPFSVLVSWIYTSLEQVGESTENPFEGSPNDVPISQICRTIEIDIKEMFGETNLPEALQPKNNIIL